MDGVWPAQQIGSVSLLATGLLLGIRHGIDWDHIAAITDIASTTTAAESTGQARVRAATDRSGGAGSAGALTRRVTFAHLEVRALWLSFLYAVGHATVVTALGILALSFAALLPDWIDPIMERVVGLTLLLLGGWVLYSLVQYARGAQDFRLQSRWMLVISSARYLFARGRARLRGHAHHEHVHVDQYGPRTAYGVGMIHGIGAETGSQALLIAAVGGAASQGLGVVMLVAFVVGLVLSNTLIAVLASTGFISSTRAKPFYLLLGAMTGVFSLVIGASFVLGIDTVLPDLETLFASAVPPSGVLAQ